MQRPKRYRVTLHLDVDETKLYETIGQVESVLSPEQRVFYVTEHKAGAKTEVVDRRPSV